VKATDQLEYSDEIAAQVRIKILSLSCVFPNPAEPGLGLFVRSRLQSVAARVAVKVISPVPLLDYWRARDNRHIWHREIARQRQDGNLEVFHPSWLYPPFGGALNAAFLAAHLLLPVIRLRRRFSFELMDAHFAHPDGVAAAILAKLLRVPFIVTLRGNETMHARHHCRAMFIRWALRRADRVICVSESLRQFAISLGVNPARAKTIPNGIDTTLFYPRDRVDSRYKHEIDENAMIILSVGALIERKGHHRIIQAVKELQDEGVNAHLLIAGSAGREGRCEDQLHRLVSNLTLESKVRFLGQVKPEFLPELMSAADVLCLSTTREGWPNVVHEAMGCGTPVVATSVSGIPDMIPSDRFGIVVPVNDPAALRNALHAALDKQWDRHEIAAWARSRSWEQVAREVLEQMQAILTAAANEKVRGT